jgi:hypothetical protein
MINIDGEKNIAIETLRHYWLKSRLSDGQFIKEVMKLTGRIIYQMNGFRLTRLGQVKLVEYPKGWAIIRKDKTLYAE